MPTEAKKLLENVSLGLAAEVTALRMKQAGVIVEPATNQVAKPVASTRVPDKLIKLLAQTKRPAGV